MKNILQTINLQSLMEVTSGRPEIVIGIIDGPVDSSHADLRDVRLKSVSIGSEVSCIDSHSSACKHGTFVAGMISGMRGTPAPAICPDCTVVVSPIFSEGRSCDQEYPRVSPELLASAIVDTIEAGARIINLSIGLSATHMLNNREVKNSFDYAFRKGILLIAASGNQGRIGYVPLFNHHWVIPVVACDSQGHLEKSSNIGMSVGRRGLMAPGVGVISTSSSGGYLKMSGTSVAAPFVTGTAALLWSLFPKATSLDLRRALLLPGTPRKGVIPPLLNAGASWSVLGSIFNTLPDKGEMKMEEKVKQMVEGQGNSGELSADIPKITGTLQDKSAVITAQGDVTPPATSEEIVSPPTSSYTEDTVAEEMDEAKFIYALGTIQARFPTLAVEKEFAQATAMVDTANLTNQQTIYKILRQEGNRYLARELCWVFSVENLDTYILQPSSEHELEQLIEAVKPVRGIDCDTIIGKLGPLAAPEACNGLQVPIAYCDKIYSFDQDAFLKSIPRPKGMKEEHFVDAAKDMLERIMQLTDNAGQMDEHRAVNYLALRYPRIYELALSMYHQEKSLSAVDVRPSRLSSSRTIVQIIFSYMDRKTDVIDKYFTRVDVTEEWPFLITKLQPFYDR